MAASFNCIAYFFKDRQRIGELEKEFILRRNIAQKVLADPEYLVYLHNLSMDNLENKNFFYNSLCLEASKLDDEYRRIMGKQSSPNYEQLMTMYRGVKNIIRREIEHRRRCSEV